MTIPNPAITSLPTEPPVQSGLKFTLTDFYAAEIVMGILSSKPGVHAEMAVVSDAYEIAQLLVERGSSWTMENRSVLDQFALKIAVGICAGGPDVSQTNQVIVDQAYRLSKNMIYMKKFREKNRLELVRKVA